MTTYPKVSVLIPAHNARSTIGLTLSSLYAQTWPASEVIVVDDGSTDDTWDVVQALRTDRVRLHRQGQQGAAAARNTALRLAQGDYIGFVDADDFLFPEYLQRSITLLRESGPKTLVTHNAFFLHTDGLNPRSVRHRHSPPADLSAQQDALLRTNFVSIMSVFPRALTHDVKGFDESLERAEDWDYWLQASFAGWRFVHQEIPMALINRTHDSLTSATERVASAEADILRKALRTQVLTQRQTTRIQERLVTGEPSQLWASSDEALCAGDYRQAATLHWEATRMADSRKVSVMKAAIFRGAPWAVGRYLRRHDRRSSDMAVPSGK